MPRKQTANPVSLNVSFGFSCLFLAFQSINSWAARPRRYFRQGLGVYYRQGLRCASPLPIVRLPLRGSHAPLPRVWKTRLPLTVGRDLRQQRPTAAPPIGSTPAGIIPNTAAAMRQPYSRNATALHVWAVGLSYHGSRTPWQPPKTQTNRRDAPRHVSTIM